MAGRIGEQEKRRASVLTTDRLILFSLRELCSDYYELEYMVEAQNNEVIITDIAVLEITSRGLLLKEIAPSWTPEEVQEITEAKLVVSSETKTMEL